MCKAISSTNAGGTPRVDAEESDDADEEGEALFRLEVVEVVGLSTTLARRPIPGASSPIVLGGFLADWLIVSSQYVPTRPQLSCDTNVLGTY